jgi:hypothetical protein
VEEADAGIGHSGAIGEVDRNECRRLNHGTERGVWGREFETMSGVWSGEGYGGAA